MELFLSITYGIAIVAILIRQQFLLRKLSYIGDFAASSHTLLGKKMKVQIRLDFVLAKRIAEITKLPEDAAMAEEVELVYRNLDGG